MTNIENIQEATIQALQGKLDEYVKNNPIKKVDNIKTPKTNIKDDLQNALIQKLQQI